MTQVKISAMPDISTDAATAKHPADQTPPTERPPWADHLARFDTPGDPYRQASAEVIAQIIASGTGAMITEVDPQGVTHYRAVKDLYKTSKEEKNDR